jgi:hypothetical protein
MGVKVVLPEQCTLLHDPALLYGYESHDVATGILRDEYKRKEWKHSETIRLDDGSKITDRAEAPKELKDLIAQEEAEEPRPDWSLGPLPDRTDGGIEANG